MNVRLKKEIQSVLWPWLAVALLGLLPIFGWVLPAEDFNTSFRTFNTLSSAGFFFGVVLLSTLPFGEELNLRTMPMLLSQPITRWQVWREKLRITFLTIASIVLIYLVSYLPFISLIEHELKIIVAFLIFTLCSATFWTLLARSTIGGAVLCLFSQAVIMLIAYAFTQKSYFTAGMWMRSSQTENLLVAISLMLSPILLWLGWRMFSKLQPSGNWDNESPISFESKATGSKLALLRMSSISPFRNIILKELRLYKPVFVMISLFASLWLAAALTNHFTSQKQVVLSNLLNGITLIYVPLVLLISGCISLGEEKNLGIHLTNLTSPISTARQWLLKIIVATLVGISGGIIVPILLVELEKLFAGRVLDTAISNIHNGTGTFWSFCLLLTSSISLSFWAATVLNRTIHAAFFAGFILVAVAVFHRLGFGMGNDMGWLTAKPILWFTANHQLSLSWFQWKSIEILFISYSLLGFLFLALSWRHYRWLDLAPRRLFANTTIVLAASFAIGMTVGDVRRSSDYQNMEKSALYQETLAALKASSTGLAMSLNRNPRQLYLEELAANGKLSIQTKKWLENCIILPSHETFQINGTEHIQVIVELAGGRDSLGFYIPIEASLPSKRLNKK